MLHTPVALLPVLTTSSYIHNNMGRHSQPSKTSTATGDGCIHVSIDGGGGEKAEAALPVDIQGGLTYLAIVLFACMHPYRSRNLLTSANA